jgi:hypothetical protein
MSSSIKNLEIKYLEIKIKNAICLFEHDGEDILHR